MEPAILQKDGSITMPGAPGTATPPNGAQHHSGVSKPSRGLEGSSTASPANGAIGGGQNNASNLGAGAGLSSGTGSYTTKTGLSQMLKGGVIMDVMSVEQAIIAEQAGACAVMVLEKIPSLIRKQGGVARMTDPKLIKEIQDTVSIPVMAKARIGHFVEAQILQAAGVDYIDESEVLTAADDQNHIAKHQFKVPFVCGAKNLGEALRRISEGAAFIRTKGEPGTGDVKEAVRHQRIMQSEIRAVAAMNDEELYAAAKNMAAPYHLLKEVQRLKRLPVVSFSAGGIATPADAALMMQLGCDGVFVGSGIFEAQDPALMAKQIVQATTHFQNPQTLLACSTGLGESMKGVQIQDGMLGGRMANKNS